MTKYYAKLNLNGSIESTMESEEETITDTLVELASKPDWSSKPSPCHKPFHQNGELVWIASSEDIREHRNQLLIKSDWTQLPDVPSEVSQKWVVYRQNLRDIPQQSGYPSDIVWPVPPAA